MKVSELKRKLEKIDDDLEIYVAPMIEMEMLEGGNKLMPSPFLHFELVKVVQSASMETDPYSFCILFGFDDSVNHAAKPEITGEDFIN